MYIRVYAETQVVQRGGERRRRGFMDGILHVQSFMANVLFSFLNVLHASNASVFQ